MFGIERIHFVGIGGSGMSGIAEVLINMGYKVTGSDIRKTPVIERLISLGAEVKTGHSPENVKDADVVVYSSAVKEDNPEIVEARKRKIPVIPRAEMLAELMRMKYSIAVAGTHGKTTTTSMIASILKEGGLDPTMVVGGILKTIGTGAILGKGEYFVAEADESDRSFLKLLPTIVVITNIDREHLDHYKDLDEIKNTFVEFAGKVPFYGSVFLSTDDPNSLDIRNRIERRVITFGLSPQADVKGVEVELRGFSSSFTVKINGEELGRIELSIPGIHNVKNALAAVGVGLELGIPFECIQRALSSFRGVSRRFELRGEKKGIRVYDDYAHHPREIEATLEAARTGWKGRIIVVFQPHLYSRTLHLADEFGKSFFLADKVIITEIYPAREEPIPGVSGRLIYEKCREYGHKNVEWIEKKEEIPEKLVPELREGDMVILMGAGDIWKLHEEILRRIDEVL